ncbi:MAG: CocE/NonD family hydrolase, partial [Candidatus Lokiarchaeota archaeon]|nr:CocE/NonD family hydrolase [Candidatus Lokiarchaeota archaeon]
KRTMTWPPEGQASDTWYLRAGHALSREAPGDAGGSDANRVDPGAGTGIRNRIYTLLSLPVDYPRRDVADQRLLVYTSEPITAPMEVTGHPVVTLHLRTDKDDGMVIVYLEFVDPGGRVHMVTEGLLRFMHRKVSRDEPPYKLTFPYHSFKRADALPVVPGEAMELVFALYPTSVLLPAGSRLRVAVAGADKDTYARYPAEGEPPTLTVERNAALASGVSLPVIPRGL